MCSVLIKVSSKLNKGYQRQLTYKRADGSFSSFGERDRSGSTWYEFYQFLIKIILSCIVFFIKK